MYVCFTLSLRPYALTPNTGELIHTLGALFPRGGPVQDPVLTLAPRGRFPLALRACDGPLPGRAATSFLASRALSPQMYREIVRIRQLSD